MASVWGELRRRNVFKVGAAYAIVAWLLLQITDVVLPIINAPLWVAQTIAFVLAIGFPLALIVAWAAEPASPPIPPNGPSPRTRRVQPWGQQLSYISQGLVLLAVGFLVVDQYVLDPQLRLGLGVGLAPILDLDRLRQGGPFVRRLAAVQLQQQRAGGVLVQELLLGGELPDLLNVVPDRLQLRHPSPRYP